MFLVVIGICYRFYSPESILLLLMPAMTSAMVKIIVELLICVVRLAARGVDVGFHNAAGGPTYAAVFRFNLFTQQPFDTGGCPFPSFSSRGRCWKVYQEHT
ncbi:hypothetical protein AcW1_006457 [Taiwanofungus camphoratus]|nr:hypothetical protein AcW2_005218 [Antrodia cinnamomea]KAI0954624.1 hypothetical protein AcW1_006457 [Antrodia cinnamomea]